MYKLLSIIFAILVTGCASTSTPKPELDMYLTMLSGKSNYVEPISRKDWVATDFNWYIDRTVEVKENVIKYRALFDNRVAREQFMKSAADSKLKNNYPSFVVHEGTVNCDLQDNTVNEIEVKDDFKSEIRHKTYYVMTEVAQNLCLMHIILHK